MYTIDWEYAGGVLSLSPESGIHVLRAVGLCGLQASLTAESAPGGLGERVRGAVVSGRTVRLTGVIPDGDRDAKRRLLRAFLPGSRGRLLFNDGGGAYFLEAYVTDAPLLTQERHSRFTLGLRAPYPYWLTCGEMVCTMGEVVREFSFPRSYETSHRFGTSDGSAPLRTVNPGDADAELTLTLTAGGGGLTDPALTDAESGRVLALSGFFPAGSVFTLRRAAGEIVCMLRTSEGEAAAADRLLASADLFTLSPGAHLLRLTGTGASAARTVLTFRAPYAGVLAEGV